MTFDTNAYAELGIVFSVRWTNLAPSLAFVLLEFAFFARQALSKVVFHFGVSARWTIIAFLLLLVHEATRDTRFAEARRSAPAASRQNTCGIAHFAAAAVCETGLALKLSERAY